MRSRRDSGAVDELVHSGKAFRVVFRPGAGLFVVWRSGHCDLSLQRSVRSERPVQAMI